MPPNVPLTGRSGSKEAAYPRTGWKWSESKAHEVDGGDAEERLEYFSRSAYTT